jgi:hypothetical protein
MALTASDHVAPGQQRHKAHAGGHLLGLGGQNGKIDRTIAQRHHHLVEIAVGLLEMDIVETLLELGHDQGHHAVHEHRRSTNPQTARMAFTVTRHGQRRLGIGAMDRRAEFGQMAPQFGGDQRPSPRFEQGHADTLFKKGHDPRHRGLRFAQHGGPFGQPALFHDGGQDLKMFAAQLHNSSIYSVLCRPQYRNF